ncbi:Uncharacterised protein [Cardiobacterium valvarum]|uniref:Uncharacterized protein n=1 Tax=Cardiobacterium valvarum TaxID=194702 RepID=A0A381E0I4_9GAMM|nr:Uncharacterised protein [Cardiobacterium valvarum]
MNRCRIDRRAVIAYIQLFLLIISYADTWNLSNNTIAILTEINNGIGRRKIECKLSTVTIPQLIEFRSKCSNRIDPPTHSCRTNTNLPVNSSAESTSSIIICRFCYPPGIGSHTNDNILPLQANVICRRCRQINNGTRTSLSRYNFNVINTILRNINATASHTGSRVGEIQHNRGICIKGLWLDSGIFEYHLISTSTTTMFYTANTSRIQT